MKYKNLIKLLSVLLCMVMLLAACNNGKTEETDSEQTSVETTEATSETVTEENTETEKPDDVYVEVAPEFGNFIKFEYEIDWKELSEVKRVDDVIYTGDDYVVIRDAVLDNEGVVTESYKVLDLVKSTVVLEASHQYKYRSNYDVFDWNVVDPQMDYQESIMYVELISLTSVGIIHLARAEFTVTEEETLCDGTVERVYESSFRHEYYDMSGAELAVTDTMGYGISLDYQSLYGHYICLRAGVKKIFIDKETGLLVSVVNENESTLGGFDYENDRYGYYFDNYATVGIDNDLYYFEVYRKFTGEIKRYYLSSDWRYGNEYIGVLQNGDVVVQLRCELPDEKGIQYDVLDSGVYKYDLKTFIYDVSEGECREIELNYMLEAVYEQEKFCEMFNVEGSGVCFTQNAWNIAVAHPIKDKNSENARVVIFNNNMDALFELDPIAPDHYISVNDNSLYWSLGMKVLKTGDILIDIGTHELNDADGYTVYSAIVTPAGNVRCYVPYEYTIVGECIVGDKNIYDFDMNPIFSLEDEEMTFKGVIGEKIIVSKTAFEWEWSDYSNMFEKVGKTEYYALSASAGNVVKVQVFKDEKLADNEYGWRCITDDYVITCSKDYYNGEQKFTLYNANLEPLLVTHGRMSVSPMEEGYLVTSYVAGVTISYTVK